MVHFDNQNPYIGVSIVSRIEENSDEERCLMRWYVYSSVFYQSTSTGNGRYDDVFNDRNLDRESLGIFRNESGVIHLYKSKHTDTFIDVRTARGRWRCAVGKKAFFTILLLIFLGVCTSTFTVKVFFGFVPLQHNSCQSTYD